MKYFILFSLILIVASVIVLLVPSNQAEGFQNVDVTNETNKPSYEKEIDYMSDIQVRMPSAASQHNSSSNAGSADGSSDHQHLLDSLIQKHDRLAEAFENRDQRGQGQSSVSATTTQKKAIATTSDDVNADADANNAKPNTDCSTCQIQVNPNTNCVLPGCYSSSDTDAGHLPFPDTDGYNFSQGCFYYNPDPKNPGNTLLGMQGRQPGYYCPLVTKGKSYEAISTKEDVCYNKQDPTKLNTYIPNYSKFVLMDKTCSINKKPSKKTPAPSEIPKPSSNPSDSTQLGHNEYIINVYHHQVTDTTTKETQNERNQGIHIQHGYYIEPQAGATFLGYL